MAQSLGNATMSNADIDSIPELLVRHMLEDLTSPSSSTEDHRLGARIMMRRVLGHSTTGLQQPAGPAGLQVVNHQDQGVTSLSGGTHSSGSGSSSIYGAPRAPTAAAKDVTTSTGPAKQARPAAAGASGNPDATRPAVKATAPIAAPTTKDPEEETLSDRAGALKKAKASAAPTGKGAGKQPAATGSGAKPGATEADGRVTEVLKKGPTNGEIMEARKLAIQADVRVLAPPPAFTTRQPVCSNLQDRQDCRLSTIKTKGSHH